MATVKANPALLAFLKTQTTTATTCATKLATHKGQHQLRKYCAAVYFPIHKGGGMSLYKSRHTVTQLLASRSGYEAYWL